MKHTLSVILLGCLVAVATHIGWYHFHQPCRGEALDCQLAWMKTELGLSAAQFERLKAIHAMSSPRLLALAAEIRHLRDAQAAFEHERTTASRIDFVAFARFVEQRRIVDRDCLESKHQLITAACDVLDEPQRARYLDLLSPALAGSGGRIR